MPRSGDVLDGRYRLDALVATGGMGEVWRATDVTLGRLVAVKLLRPALLADPQFDARFQVEARIMAALTHPNVINIYDYGHAPAATGGGAYLVMSYVDGQPLSRRIAEAGRLSVAETGSMLVQAAKALHATHRGGIIHCDVKPANLLITPDGTVILVDFGAARPTAATAAEILGTASYMAPEQVTGEPVTPATDVYALGAVAYHCVAGRPPFTGKTALQITLRHLSDEPPPLPADVPPELRRLITRAMNKVPAHRYPTAAHFAAAVHRSLTTRGPTSPKTVDLPVRADAPGRTRRARRYVATAASAVAMLLFTARANAVAGPAETTGDGGPARAYGAQRAATDR